jgi:hypothetical protein
MLLWPFHTHTSAEIKAVFPLPTAVKGKLKIAEKREVATVILWFAAVILSEITGLFLRHRHGVAQLL